MAQNWSGIKEETQFFIKIKELQFRAVSSLKKSMKCPNDPYSIFKITNHLPFHLRRCFFFLSSSSLFRFDNQNCEKLSPNSNKNFFDISSIRVHQTQKKKKTTTKRLRKREDGSNKESSWIFIDFKIEAFSSGNPPHLCFIFFDFRPISFTFICLFSNQSWKISQK